MSINIQEINGVLHKIIENKIDQFNVKRTAVPLTEEEFDNIESMVGKAHEHESNLLKSAKTKGKLKKKEDLDKIEDKPEAPKTTRTDVFKKKNFSLNK